jgi:hypothetical protein
MKYTQAAIYIYIKYSQAAVYVCTKYSQAAIYIKIKNGPQFIGTPDIKLK